MRMIVHPGFHKTGTSTVQTALRAAREALPGWIVALREDMPDAPAAARAYSRSRDPVELGLFQAALADWLDALPDDAEGIVISAEGLSGHMPGRGAVTDYSATPALMGALAEVMRLHFGLDLDLRLYLTVRDPARWVESLHWQHVRSGALAEPLTVFRARLGGKINIAPVLCRIETAIAPAAVTVTTLEEIHTLRCGLLTPILDLMGLSPEAWEPVASNLRENARPRQIDRPALADRLAAINAEGLPQAEAQKKKRAVMAAAWREDRRARATNV